VVHVHAVSLDDRAKRGNEVPVDFDRVHLGAGLDQREVNEPRPAPISSTWSPGPTFASRAMRRTVLGSTTKFWPSAREGVTPCSLSSATSSVRVRVTTRL